MLQQHAASVLVVVTCMLWGGAVIAGLTRRIARMDDGTDTLSLVVGAWMLPALAASALALLIGAVAHNQKIVQLVAAVGALAALGFAWSGGRWRAIASQGFVASSIPLAVILTIFALVRLAFMKTLILPLYFDSATHYGLIRQLLSRLTAPGSAQALVLPAPTYYHLGYHILLAGWISLVRVDVAELMLVSGQLILVAAPVPLYLLAHRSTGSRLAALMAVVLGATGWYAPAHAVNWGKYPVLFSMLPMLSAINLAYLAVETGVDPQARRKLIALAIVAAGAAVVVQTRSIIVLTMAITAWMLSRRWLTLRPSRRWMVLALVLLVVAMLGVYVARDAVLVEALDPYLRAGAWVTGLVGLLCVFAFQSFPQVAFASLLTLAFLLAGLVIPAPIPAAGTLLDRPLVEMLLFAPLSILGAAGLAGMLRSLHPRWQRLGPAAGTLILLAVVVHALANYGFHPSPCCAIVTTDDLVALDWLSKGLPADAQVAIASTQLRVAPASYAPLEAPVDAGVWIQPLTGLRTTALPAGIDFGDGGTLGLICERGVKYVYVGSASQSFDARSLQGRPAWYRSRLELSTASIYEVTACRP